MKKILSMILVMFATCWMMFATSYKLNVKGEVYVKSEDGEMYVLEEGENTVQLEDTIIVGEKTTVTIYVESNKIVIRAAGAYKVADLVK